MKKITLMLILGGMVLGITGCGSKQETLKCTGKQDDTEMTITGTFKDSKLTKMVMESVTTFNSTDDIESQYGILQLTVGMMNAMEGVEGTLSKNDTTATMKITADLSKMSAESKENMFDKEISSKEDFKAYVTEEGLTCK